MRGETRRTIAACWLAVSLGLAGTTALGQARTVYYSGFEPGQDYDAEFTLIDQDDWQGEGTGGNGLVEDDFEGLGQQGYIGYWPPEEDGETFTSLWRPVKGVDPEETKVTFTVLIMIIDSTNDQRDDFRWAVYNSDVQRLVTLDFDNETRNINYALDDNIFLPTGYSFEHEALYELKFVMDFASNNWSVSVGDEVLFKSKTLTTTGASLTFGDLGPLWVYRKPKTPGNNYMVFDEYKITVETSNEPLKIPPTLAWTGWTDDGRAILQLGGDATTDYTVEVSHDLETWTPLQTAKPGDTWMEIADDEAPDYEQRFYRARTAD
jgi:hypothetical protein